MGYLKKDLVFSVTFISFGVSMGNKAKMTQVIIIYDRFNKVWLQNAEEPYVVQWTSEETQCSFYEPAELPELLERIAKQADGEVWIEAKTIYVNV